MIERESTPTPEDGDIDTFGIRTQSPNALIRQAHTTINLALITPIYKELLRRQHELDSDQLDYSHMELYEKLSDALTNVGSLLIDLRKSSEAMFESLFNVGDDRVETQPTPLHDELPDKDQVSENDAEFLRIMAVEFKD